MKRDLVLKLLLLFFVLVICFVVLEVAFRSFAPQAASVNERDLFYEYNPLLGWSLIPGVSGEFSSSEFSVSVSVNEDGLRDSPDFEAEKKVLFFGDSFVWGYGVEEYEGMSEQLELLLENYEVVNYGQSGYSSDQELLLYQSLDLDYVPEMIFVFVYPNDFDGNAQEIVYQKRKPRFSLENGALSFHSLSSESVGLFESLKSVLRRSHFVLFLYRLSVPSLDYGGDPETIALSCALLERFDEVSGEIPFEVILIPHKDKLQLGEASYDASFLSCLEGLSYLNLEDEFSSLDVSSLYFERDQHFNPKGHRVVAEILREKYFS